MTKPLTPVDREGLRRLATEATPGPWRNGFDLFHYDSPEVTDDSTFSYYVPNDKDAAFIAAANPAAVLALVNELDERDRLLRECRDMLPDVLMEAAESDLVGRIDQALGEKP